jgi:large subunit ribosomal protein L29
MPLRLNKKHKTGSACFITKTKRMATKEIKGLSDQELFDKIKEEKAALNKMVLNHAISPVENPAKIRINRRNIAKMLTEANSRKNASNK